MKYHVNKNIRSTVRVFPEQGRYAKHRYDMNENPKGLPKSFVKSVLREVTPEFLAIYPEPDRFIKNMLSIFQIRIIFLQNMIIF